jgi:dihydropteroate synthase
LLWKLRTQALDISQGALMGVVNVTPDSFSDGGESFAVDDAVRRGLLLREQGAAIVDVGGESTRPGSRPVSAAEEKRRVLPVVEGLTARGVVVSVDTSKPEVAAAAIELGAEIVNDITACASPGMADLVAAHGVGVVLMHMRGEPRTMQENPVYENVVAEVRAFLAGRVEAVARAGLDPASIAIDPGIGFGKAVRHNLSLIDGLADLASLGHPVVLGASRKSFLGKLAGVDEPGRRDGLTAITTALGFDRGARVFRVHNVPSSRDALMVAAAIVDPQ